LNEVGKSKVIMSGIHEIYTEQVIKIFLSGLTKQFKDLNELG